MLSWIFLVERGKGWKGKGRRTTERKGWGGS